MISIHFKRKNEEIVKSKLIYNSDDSMGFNQRVTGIITLFDVSLSQQTWQNNWRVILKYQGILIANIRVISNTAPTERVKL